MQVLLLKTNQIQEVKDSYAVNYLIPKGLAVLATNQLQKDIADKQTQKLAETKQKQKILVDLAQKYSNKTFILKVKTNSEGHLYAAISDKQIRKLLKISQPIKISNIPEIKKIGLYNLEIKIGSLKIPINLKIIN